jgi:hypothetical protein
MGSICANEPRVPSRILSDAHLIHLRRRDIGLIFWRAIDPISVTVGTCIMRCRRTTLDVVSWLIERRRFVDKCGRIRHAPAVLFHGKAMGFAPGDESEDDASENDNSRDTTDDNARFRTS